MAAIVRRSPNFLFGARSTLRALVSSPSFETHRQQKNCKRCIFFVSFLSSRRGGLEAHGISNVDFDLVNVVCFSLPSWTHKNQSGWACC